MLAPMLPTIDRDRTMIPRTTPNVLVTRKPGRSNVVVVKGWVWLINRGPIEHETAFKQKRNFSVAGARSARVSQTRRCGVKSSWISRWNREIREPRESRTDWNR